MLRAVSLSKRSSVTMMFAGRDSAITPKFDVILMIHKSNPPQKTVPRSVEVWPILDYLAEEMRMKKDSTNVKESVLLIVAVSLLLTVSTAMAQEPSTRVSANTKASSGVPLRTAIDATGVGTQNFIAKW